MARGEGWKQGTEEDLSEISKCLCPNCRRSNAATVMLPTQIPLFREIIIMTLTCEDCGFVNSEVTFGGQIQEKGKQIVLRVNCEADRNRQIVKSDSATFLVPKLEFEIPPHTQRGSVSTLEGFLKRAADNLEEAQAVRLQFGDIDSFQRCLPVIAGLRRYAGVEIVNDDAQEEDSCPFPFDVVLDDPAGNSFIENLHAPAADPGMVSTSYFRTPSQDMALGLQPSRQAMEDGSIVDTNPAHKNPVNSATDSDAIHVDVSLSKNPEGFTKREVMKFPTPCPHCNTAAETDMCVINVPHFKEAVVMTLLCDQCGYRSSEVKGSGSIQRDALKITLNARGPADLAREVLKSDTAGIEVRELELELEEGGLGGLYTTVEGLLTKIHDHLKMANPFGFGDSATKQHLTNDGRTFSPRDARHERYVKILARLRDIADGKVFPFTLIVSDPLSNSFVGPIPEDAPVLSSLTRKDGTDDCYSATADDGILIETFERTREQNDRLGLNDMNTESY